MEVNVSHGFPTELDISWGDYNIVQCLYYKGIPFCFHRCLFTGHLRSSYHGFPREGSIVEDERFDISKKEGNLHPRQKMMDNDLDANMSLIICKL